MSLLQNIKKGVASSGSNKGKIVYLKADSKTRVRFLQEVEDGIEVTIHDSFDRGITSVCQKHFKGRKCPHCKDTEMRTRQAYVWSVWETDAKEVKLYLGYANNFSHLPQLISMYESYGTLMDRDYILQKDGGGMSSRFGVVPMDKVKFKNSKAKAFTKAKTMEILDKAYPVGEDVDTSNDDDEDDDFENEDEVDGDEEESEYDDMSPKELYMECVERGLKAKKKQKAAYYIDLLEADDLENEDDEDEEDEEDEW